MQADTLEAQGSANPEQHFQRILISTPLQYKYYNNVTFKTAQTNLMNQLQKLMQSSFYSHFVVYFGAENLSHRSYIEQKYKRQEEILKLKIEETKKNIFQLSRANDEIEFDNSMKSYIQSMKIISDRSQDVDHVDFVPCIYVQGKRKKTFYGHLMQQFNRKGAGTFNVKVGLRSPFSKLDTLELNLQTPISNVRRKYFNFDLEWNNSYETVGKIFTKISHSNQSVFRDIDQKSQSFSMGIDRPQSNLRFEWENKVRSPNIHQRFDEYCRRNYHLPSFKSSFRLTKVWQNTIQFNDVNMGRYLETKGQITLPYISKTQFAKFELNYRKFYDIIAIKKYFDSQLMKKVFSSSSIQTNLSWNVMKPITGNYLSDITENMQVRGFDQARVPTPTFSNGKVSAKFNLHNYPLIGQARLTPFLYAQTGFSILDRSGQKNEIQKKKRWLYGLGSIGLGVAYYIKAFAQIELVYSLGSYQNLAKREPSNFQIRIGFFD